MNRFRLFLEVTRARTLPVMAAPVIIGSVLAWQQGAPFQWGLFVLTLIGALAAHLGANVTNDVYDFGAGTDQAAQAIMPQGNTVTTGSQFLLNGKLSIRSYRGLAIACFAVALLSGIVAWRTRHTDFVWHLTPGRLLLRPGWYSYICRFTGLSANRPVYDGGTLLPPFFTLACR